MPTVLIDDVGCQECVPGEVAHLEQQPVLALAQTYRNAVPRKIESGA